jgi:hypothetical protein
MVMGVITEAIEREEQRKEVAETLFAQAVIRASKQELLALIQLLVEKKELQVIGGWRWEVELEVAKVAGDPTAPKAPTWALTKHFRKRAEQLQKLLLRAEFKTGHKRAEQAVAAILAQRKAA